MKHEHRNIYIMTERRGGRKTLYSMFSVFDFVVSTFEFVFFINVLLHFLHSVQSGAGFEPIDLVGVKGMVEDNVFAASIGMFQNTARLIKCQRS